MNGSAAKGIRRDLRRAMGQEAIAIVDEHTTALNQAMPVVGNLVKELEQHKRDLDTLRTIATNELAILHRRASAWDAKSRWQRLRWLVTGR